MDADRLIEQYIDTDWLRADQARLKDVGVEVWALMAYLQYANDGNVEQTAKEYGLSLEAMQAAQAYYDRHRALISARILLNNPALAA